MGEILFYFSETGGRHFSGRRRRRANDDCQEIRHTHSPLNKQAEVSKFLTYGPSSFSKKCEKISLQSTFLSILNGLFCRRFEKQVMETNLSSALRFIEIAISCHQALLRSLMWFQFVDFILLIRMPNYKELNYR